VVCHLHRLTIDRLDKLIVAGKAESRAVNSRCGHTMVYRSLGLWTEARPLSVVEIAERSLPPGQTTEAPVSRESEYRRLWVASKTT
jgi:hypothetical protein